MLRQEKQIRANIDALMAIAKKVTQSNQAIVANK